MSDRKQIVIAELKDGESGGFAPRGAVRELWKSRDFETLVSGPAETGKTWGSLQYADALLWKYPGAQGVLCRKTYASLIGSAVRTYLRILGSETPVVAYGGEKPQWFDYPNGSRLWVVGLDNPGKALSSERDFIYINQAEELELVDFETLLTRVTGRGAVMPYTRIFGDCNPGPPSHWIINRRDAKKLRLLESRHEDNPTLFDDAGGVTEQGRKTLSILDSLTGVLKQRLRHGKWAAAEGAVYERFTRAVHVIPRDKVPTLRRYVASVDWGFTNPGIMQVWGVDGDGRMYLLREVVRTKQTIDFWKAVAVRLAREFPIDTFACDPAEPAFIMQIQQAGVAAIGGFNDIEAGVNAVRERLEEAGDGMPRLFICEDAVEERDELMEMNKLPIGTAAEMEVYAYPKGADGKPVKETPVDQNNHSCDAARYAVAFIDNLRGGLDFGSLDFGAVRATCGT